MAMADNEAEADTDMDLMLSCLEETSEDVIIQALQTISAMCSNPNAQNLFHQKGGVNRIWSLLKQTKQPLVTQCALFSLGCAVERNVSSQMALCKPEFFQLLTAILCDPQESLVVKCTSAFLTNVLVCHNSTGQRLARETTLLKAMMDIFRSLCDQKAALSDIHSASFNLLASVCTALGAAVNNPENVDNQRRCCSMFPAIAGIVSCLTTAKHLSPVLGFLNACATSNYMNQERVRVVGVLTALVKRLQRTELAAGEEGGDIVCSVLLVDALVHCSNANKNNQERLVELEVVPPLVRLVGRTEEASQLLKVVTCLQLLTADNTDAQHQLQEQGGIAPLIRVMAESQDSDLKQVTVLVLQSCLGEKPTTDLPEADMAIQRLQCLLDKLDSFDRSTHLEKKGGSNTEERTYRDQKQCDATLRQSVATLNKRVATMTQSDTKVQQKGVISSQSDEIQRRGDATLRQPSPSPQSEPTTSDSSPEVPHSVQPDQHGSGAVTAPTGLLVPISRAHAASSTATSKRTKAMSGVLPMSVGSEQLQQITSSLQQIHSDLQTLEQMHRTSQVSVQTKLKTLEGNLKSLESKQQASCSPQPLPVSNNQLHFTLKPTNANSLVDSSLNSMPPPKTLLQVKPGPHGPSSAGSCKSQRLSSCHSQRYETCADSRRFVGGTNIAAAQEGSRKSGQGCCAMCSASSLGVPDLTSRSLLKVVYNSSSSCPIHEDFAKWAFTTKQQRNLLCSQDSCGSTAITTSLQHPPAPGVMYTPDTPHSLPSSVATINQGSALHELALNESYIIHKAGTHGAMSTPAAGHLHRTHSVQSAANQAVLSSYAFTSATRRKTANLSSSATGKNAMSSLPDSSGLACAPAFASRMCAPSRDAGRSSQRAVPRVVSSNLGRHRNNFKHTPSRKGKLRDVYEFDSPSSAENRPPLRCHGGTRASKMYDHTPVSHKHRTPFTLDEEDYVIQGVARFGKRWRHVLTSYPFNSCRTVVDLKDKYRNLIAKRIAPSSR